MKDPGKVGDPKRRPSDIPFALAGLTKSSIKITFFLPFSAKCFNDFFKCFFNDFFLKTGGEEAPSEICIFTHSLL